MTSLLDKIEQSDQIIRTAIKTWKPTAIISLFSGGYDSLTTTHLAHALDFRPTVYAINTKMSADGWHDYVFSVAAAYSWKFSIYDNQKGFLEWVEWVRLNGCPYSREGHHKTYNRLKGRGIEAILKRHKGHYYNKVLFLSGIRQSESKEREKLTKPINRLGKSNAIYVNPIFYWSHDDVLEYRLKHNLPTNPFYETVGGSGDCQCNWGQFITLPALARHSPRLAEGNVALIDEISRENHGYGWDEEPGRRLFNSAEIDEGQFTSPFLCSNCSRSHSPAPGKSAAAEAVYMDRLFEL